MPPRFVQSYIFPLHQDSTDSTHICRLGLSIIYLSSSSGFYRLYAYMPPRFVQPYIFPLHQDSADSTHICRRGLFSHISFLFIRILQTLRIYAALVCSVIYLSSSSGFYRLRIYAALVCPVIYLSSSSGFYRLYAHMPPWFVHHISFLFIRILQTLRIYADLVCPVIYLSSSSGFTDSTHICRLGLSSVSFLFIRILQTQQRYSMSPRFVNLGLCPHHQDFPDST